MLLSDVNILVYAFRKESPDHERFKAWLEDLINGDEAFGLSDIVCSGFLRVVTHPAIFVPATSFDAALSFIEGIRGQPNCSSVEPGERHWGIFTEMCRASGSRGKHVADAYLAAIAVESGCEWVSMDSDFGRFDGLRWRRPFSWS
jgi:toxin-antitoxin system PIN domain toxin